MTSELGPLRRFLCDECGAPFKSMVRLLKHKGEKPFQCNTCDARFEKRRGLHKHLDIKLRCKSCCMMFKKAGNLEKHLELCGSETTDNRPKRNHQEDEKSKLSKVHRPYKCSGCFKVFKHLKCIKSHVTSCSMINKDETTKKNGPSGDPLAISAEENSPTVIVYQEKSFEEKFCQLIDPK